MPLMPPTITLTYSIINLQNVISVGDYIGGNPILFECNTVHSPALGTCHDYLKLKTSGTSL